MTPCARLALLMLVATAHAQLLDDRQSRYIPEQKVSSTPVPILKQINRHNEDGSYTYGYEAADGSFKIETKSPTGEVKGKYGYKDDTGKLRVIEYGANKYGFQPSGEGITVAPPTLVDETTKEHSPKQQQQGGGGRNQYRAPAPPPSRNYDYDYEEPRAAPRELPQYQPAPQAPQVRTQQRQLAPQQQYQQQQHFRPALQPQPQYRAPPLPVKYRPAPEHQQTHQQTFKSQNAAPAQPLFFAGAEPALGDTYFSPEVSQRHTQVKQIKQNTKPIFQPFGASPKPQIDYQDNDDGGPLASNFVRSRNEQPYSMLDELLKEYALPRNGAAPLHDITFGSY